MARKKYEESTERKRLQVVCTAAQEQIINEAAKRAGMEKDRSAWILAHALKGASASSGGEGAPILITGDLAERIRAEAERQGVGPEVIVQQWAIVSCGAG